MKKSRSICREKSCKQQNQRRRCYVLRRKHGAQKHSCQCNKLLFFNIDATATHHQEGTPLAMKHPYCQFDSGAIFPIPHYLFPFALLWVLHSIWQFLMLVSPPLLQAVTWSASISAIFQMRSRLLS